VSEWQIMQVILRPSFSSALYDVHHGLKPFSSPQLFWTLRNCSS